MAVIVTQPKLVSGYILHYTYTLSTFADIPDPNAHKADKIPVSLIVDDIGGEKLEPDTEYEFRVTAENSHEDTSGRPAHTVGKTKGMSACMS